MLAAEQVAKAREHDEVTWEQVGVAFGTTAQSAHVRFGPSRTRAAEARAAAKSK